MVEHDDEPVLSDQRVLKRCKKFEESSNPTYKDISYLTLMLYISERLPSEAGVLFREK